MDERPGGDSFDTRLKAARSKQGLDAPPETAGTMPPTSAMGIGLRVGIELVSAMVVSVGIGWALDRWLHTMPLFLVIFLVVGGAAGIANVWRLMAPAKPRRG